MSFIPPRRRARGRAVAPLVCLFATGCATLHELPRAEYAAKPERKGVVVDTREGLHYKFDLARFSPDTLVGQKLKDTEGPFEEYNTVAIPLEAVGIDELAAKPVSLELLVSSVLASFEELLESKGVPSGLSRLELARIEELQGKYRPTGPRW